MNLNQEKKSAPKINLKDYTNLIETIAKVEFKKLSSNYLIDYLEIVSIGTQTIHALSQTKGFEYYNNSYLSTAIKWAIRNEVRRRYKWYSSKTKKSDVQTDGETNSTFHPVNEQVYSTILSIDDVGDEDNTVPQIKDTDYTPDQYAEFVELKNILHDAVAVLPQRERELIEAKFYKEMKLSDLTIEFGISPSRITRIIQSGLTKLKAELQKRNMK